MLRNQRQQEIINILTKNDGFVSVKDLCKSLYASESSIRRDLTLLEDKGLLTKTYGGAQLIKNHSNVVTFSKRFLKNPDAKKEIAKKAKSLISDGDVLFLDQSTTSYYLANEILDNSSLTVITNNIEIISLLSASSMKVISSGGVLSRANRNCLLGEDARYIFENIHAHKVFFSAKALSESGVIYDCDREEVLLRGTMIKNADVKVFLCDSEKLDTHAPYKQCILDDIDFLITENNSGEKYKTYFSRLTTL